jgi:hypothetical protein
MLRFVHIRGRRALRQALRSQQLRADVAYVLRFTRNWIHYGWISMMVAGILVGAVRALLG